MFGGRGSWDAAIVAEAEELLVRVDLWERVKSQHVGVLLPLSGPYQRLGQAALEGIQIALGGRKDVKLIVRDTKGDAAEAAKQAERLILDRHVVAMLGPVGRHETRAAREVTTRYGVPHVLLSSDHEAAEGSDTALRLRLSRVEQAAAIARWAVTSLDVQRVAILYPENAAGERLMGAFWDEAERLGAEVRAVQGYDPETKKFSPVVRALIGAGKPGSGTVDFDALFIPDDALSVRRLVPFLKYWDITVRSSPKAGRRASRARPAVQLLGASGWNHAAVVDRGDNLTDNAVFVDTFFHDPDDVEADRFARRFYSRYKRRATTFHAEVHDAAAVTLGALAGLEGDGHGVRAQVLQNLKTTRNFRGATGFISILDHGAVVRKPRVLTIDLDDIRVRLSEDEEEALRRRRFTPREDDGPR